MLGPVKAALRRFAVACGQPRATLRATAGAAQVGTQEQAVPGRTQEHPLMLRRGHALAGFATQGVPWAMTVLANTSSFRAQATGAPLWVFPRGAMWRA